MGKKSRVKSKKSRVKSQESRVKSKESKVKNQESKVKRIRVREIEREREFITVIREYSS